jgi:hypothetical protein
MVGWWWLFGWWAGWLAGCFDEQVDERKLIVVTERDTQNLF